jgi:hypothetical protein
MSSPSASYKQVAHSFKLKQLRGEHKVNYSFTFY